MTLKWYHCMKFWEPLTKCGVYLYISASIGSKTVYITERSSRSAIGLILTKRLITSKIFNAYQHHTFIWNSNANDFICSMQSMDDLLYQIYYEQRLVF